MVYTVTLLICLIVCIYLYTLFHIVLHHVAQGSYIHNRFYVNSVSMLTIGKPRFPWKIRSTLRNLSQKSEIFRKHSSDVDRTELFSLCLGLFCNLLIMNRLFYFKAHVQQTRYRCRINCAKRQRPVTIVLISYKQKHKQCLLHCISLIHYQAHCLFSSK